MAITITDERRMTCGSSSHYAHLTPDGWNVSWLGAGVTLDYYGAATAMTVADLLGDNPAATVGCASDRDIKDIEDAARKLGLTLDEAITMVAVPV